MNQRMTSKQLTARTQFGSLLLAGLLSGSAAAQLPLPVSAPPAASPSADARFIAPPTLQAVPGTSPAVQLPKPLVHRLGINRSGQKRVAPLDSKAQSKAVTTDALPYAQKQSAGRNPTQLDGHATASAALQAEVMYAYSTEAAPTVAAAEHVTGNKDGVAVVRAPVPAEPLESLLDVDMSKLSPVIAPAPKFEVNLANETLLAPVQSQPPIAPKGSVAKASTPKTVASLATTIKSTVPATTVAKSTSGSGLFHLSDDSTATPAAKALPATEAPGLPSMSPTVKLALPMLPPAAITTALPSALAVERDALASPTRVPELLQPPAQPPALAAENRSREEAKPAGIVASSSQRSMSLRIGNAQLTPQSPTTRVVERRSMSSYSPVINVQPVVHVVKPIVTPEAAQAEGALAGDTSGSLQPKSNVATSVPSATSASKTERLTGGAFKIELAPSSSTAATSSTAVSGAASSDSQAQKLATKESVASDPSNEKVRAAKPTAEELVMDLVPVELLKSDDVQIEPKLVSQLNRLIKQMFPASHVEITTNDDGLIVDGVAASKSDAGKILALVRKTSLCPVIDRVITKR